MVSRARLLIGLLTLALGTACDKNGPPVPANVEAVSTAAFNSIAGDPVAAASRPSVKVTTSGGAPVPGVSVTFAVTSGGGSGGGTLTTNEDGIATVATWTLGTVAGANVMTATAEGVTASATFTAMGVAGPAAKLALVTPPSATAQNRVAFAAQPVVQLQDANSNAASTGNVTISASITSGGGTLQGTVDATTLANGTATFTNLAIAGATGTKTLTFTSVSLTSASAQVTTSPGSATTLAKEAGDQQAARPGTAVPVPPAVKVADADGNGVAGVQVTFSVTSGGGSVTDATPTSGSTGVAAVTSWTMGSAEGSNTLTATASGLSGSPLTFTATSTNTLVDVTSVSPATLTSGATATISGTGFSATAANNTVSIDGVAATVTAASGISLTVTVPTLPCTPAHGGTISVSVGGITSQRTHPVRAGVAHNLAVGASATLSTSADARCSELHNAGTSAQYYISVYNTATTYSTTGASFELKGSSAAASVASSDVRRRAAAPVRPLRRPLSREEIMERNHIEFLERDLEFLRRNGHRWGSQRRSASLVAGGTTAHAVGDAVSLRMRDLSKTTSLTPCNESVDIAGRVAFVGTRTLVIEDTKNALSGTIDSTYAQIGNEFDSVMWPILASNYGNALINDANLDANGKLVMVFTNKIDTLRPGIAGFVTSCDLFHRTDAGFPNAASNFGEYFYATAPGASGTINESDSPPRWRWSMRGTIIHEVKHIVSVAERLAKNPSAPTFEVSWLEETTARISEELYERDRYGFAQKTNIGYGSAGNPVGPYCGIRLSCNNARGIIRVFEELGDKWYQAPHDYSPIGRIDSDDFSFYATGWSLVRWGLDQSPTAEATILKNMTQHATLTGINNFDAHIGTSYVDALPKWTLAMAVDDYPGTTISDNALRQPSWDLRNVFAGYKTDFPTASHWPYAAWPLNPLSAAFGSFTATASVRAGTAAIIHLTGTQSAVQMLELKASGSTAAAPAELRMAIVRVQ